jgi:chemosensory pili system protein ChpA (sensor histidine kinase/response regulator)
MARKKILIVDDSRAARMLQQLLLQRATYDVDTAVDGIDALAKATSNPPDLILMDFEMPRMNGIESCRAIRAHEKTRNVPIIMVTTHGEESSRREALDSAVSAYLTKPIDAALLLAKIRSLLGE